uniref:LRRCT domain-containing protein n=1 Tax=Branchiostoma floridae TaxID=7739 RepID=C3ZTF4_BRAFL|eukprot:XP_002588190.1 hypothetical protein BRAFLDRAFT_68832 [Branchiostoma floridae]
MPKRAKKCPGCGQDNSLHPNGRGNKQCKGISQPVHSDTESVETTPPAGGKVKATADLERRKAELQEQLTQARLEKEVAELEEELQKARCSTEPAKETDPTLPKPTELHKTDPAHTSLLGPGDITLQQLRDNSPLQAQVTAKYPDLIGSRKKTEGKTLSPEAFVYSFESAEPKKYDELTMEEFLVGSMGLLQTAVASMPQWELAGRLSILQCACTKLARYKWQVVRSFHAAALREALRKPGSWSADWTDLKEMYFDADPTRLKPSSEATSQAPAEKPKAPKFCWAFNENDCSGGYIGTISYSSTNPILAIRGHAFGVLSSQALGSCVNHPGVQYLRLAEGGITDLEPSSLSTFLGLNLLYLDYNNLTHVKKDWFAKLRSPDALIVLSLSHNKIADIEPESFARLIWLKGLFLKNNSLSHLRPEWFRGLTDLTRLDLAYNRLQTLPNYSFVPLTKLSSLDVSNNGFIGLPNDVRLVTSVVRYQFNESGLVNVHDVRWQAELLSDLSFAQIKITSLTRTKCFTRDDEISGFASLRYNMDTRGVNNYIRYTYDCWPQYNSQVNSHSYQSPMVIMAMMNDVESEEEGNVIPWCESFWFGTETDSVNLSGNKESTFQLAAFATKNNARPVRLVSVVYDPVRSKDSSHYKLKASIQNDSTHGKEGNKNVTCVLISGERVFKSYVFMTKREESHATNEQRWNNKTVTNNGEDVIKVSNASDENSTIALPAVDVNGTLAPTEQEIDNTSTMRPEPVEDQQQTTLTVALSVSLTVLVGAVLVECLLKKRCTCQRRNAQNANAGSPNHYEIPNSSLAPPVVPVSSWAIPTSSTVNNVNPGYCRSSLPKDTNMADMATEGDFPAYWDIPDDYFCLNKPGYRYRCSSLPTDENPYWQIPDEYYNYQNTTRQANWRPSSLPLTTINTYENVGQDEDAERWQWQPSDIDAQDGDDGVTTFHAAGTEVALPTMTRFGTKHRLYENPVRRCKSLLYPRMAGEVENRVGVVTFGRQAGQKFRDVVERGAYGTTSEDRIVATYGGRSVKPNKQKKTSYKIADRLHHASRSASEVPKLYQESAGVSFHKSCSQELPSAGETRAVSAVSKYKYKLPGIRTFSVQAMGAMCQNGEFAPYPSNHTDTNRKAGGMWISWCFVRGHRFGVLSSQELAPCNHPGVRYLRLAEGGITDLEPSSLSTFLSLQFLYLDYNNLTHIKKDWFSELRSPVTLIVLSLSHNKIADIEPESFARLIWLKGLFLKNNSLSHLRPEWFLGLTDLTRLDLAYNRLQTLPNYSFVPLTKLGSLDVSNNGFIGLPNDVRLVTSVVRYQFNESGLINVHDVRWQAELLSDLSFAQIEITSLTRTKCFTRDDEISGFASLRYNMDTRGVDNYIRYTYDCWPQYNSQVNSHSYQSPMVIMAMMNDVESEEEGNVIPWCQSFWFGTETDSVNLSGNKESTFQLAAFATKDNARPVRLVSVVYDPVRSKHSSHYKLKASIQNDSTHASTT